MEVESKIKLDELQLRRVLGELAERGLGLSGPERQRDVYFAERGFRQQVQGPGSYAIRVRYTDSKTTLNLKRLTHEDGVWEEAETAVQDGAVAETIIVSAGAEHAVTVVKSRRAGWLAGLEICIDEVDGLGTFLELAVETENDTKTARRVINEFLIELGIAPEKAELRGYAAILLEQQGVIFPAR